STESLSLSTSLSSVMTSAETGTSEVESPPLMPRRTCPTRGNEPAIRQHTVVSMAIVFIGTNTTFTTGFSVNKRMSQSCHTFRARMSRTLTRYSRFAAISGRRGENADWYVSFMHQLQANYLGSFPTVRACPVPELPEYAFVGRS